MTQPNYQLLPIPAACTQRGCRRSKLYDEEKSGLLPRFVKLGRSTYMPETELSQVLAMRAAGASDEQVRALVRLLSERRKNALTAALRAVGVSDDDLAASEAAPAGAA